MTRVSGGSSVGYAGPRTPSALSGSRPPRCPGDPIPALVEAVRSVLTPDLRHRSLLKRTDLHPMAGYCYVASEALYFLLGGKEAGWYMAELDLVYANHWYLANEDGTLLDATADQFPFPVPYLRGRLYRRRSRAPRKETLEILDRLRCPRRKEVDECDTP